MLDTKDNDNNKYDEKVREFNEYARQRAPINFREVLGIKKFPDEDLFIEFEINISDHCEGVLSRFDKESGVEREYVSILKALEQTMREVRKRIRPKMSDEELLKRTLTIIPILNPNLPSSYMDKKVLFSVLTREILWEELMTRK